MRTHLIFALGVAMALAGCSQADNKPPPPNVVAAKPMQLHFPDECTVQDPPQCSKKPASPGCTNTWIPLPDGDLYTDDILRRDDQLQDRFEDVQSERRICAAAVKKAAARSK